jgi:hypothetical protein
VSLFARLSSEYIKTYGVTVDNTPSQFFVQVKALDPLPAFQKELIENFFRL